VKKLLTAVAGVTAVVTALTLLPATSASADVICVPITVDGQPLFCQDAAPVDAAIQEVTLELSHAIVTAQVLAEGAASQALTLAGCARIVPTPGGAVVYVATTTSLTPYTLTCSGEKITVTTQTTGQPVHVPQICLTTTGTCVGPVDETVPVPTTMQPLTVCIQPTSWTEPNATPGQWTDSSIPGDVLHPALGCVSVP
jgi:hypothetical protein